jgi:hypothetical protein
VNTIGSVLKKDWLAGRVKINTIVKAGKDERRYKMMQNRDLQKEITELGILGIETFDGILTQSIITDAIDAHKQTLSYLDLDKISQEINNAEKAFVKEVCV